MDKKDNISDTINESSQEKTGADALNSGSEGELGRQKAEGQPETGPSGEQTPGTEQAQGAKDAEAVPSPEEKIAELEAKLAEANNNYLRKAADMENYRKRMNQEKAAAIDYANQSLLLDLCTIIDDFERAIKAAQDQRDAAGSDSEKLAASYSSLYEGITMIERNLVSQLENKWGLKRFDSVGELFDHNKHEAIAVEKSAEQAEPVVAEEFIKGYTLKERVIRPAKVKVVMPE